MIKFKTQQSLIEESEKFEQEFHDKVDNLYKKECVKVLKWFKERFPKRHLEWCDGMGSCFWSLDNKTIYDFENLDLRIRELLNPLLQFQTAFEHSATFPCIDDGTLNTIQLGQKDPEYLPIDKIGEPTSDSLTGTAYFKTLKDAYSYYSNLGFKPQDVDYKVRQREIFIGMPLEYKELYIYMAGIDKGRYFIKT